ncbi:hypothetical protein Cni_G07199 [Canna indica]|uniref:Uncharacterized protein n=1 Tax=Canna indica TaxID=4628 RepID=A0AAQ3JYJ8_9LILI|nr:hypothetical protein Cni_G07199 [Canna indica]
MVLNRSPRLPEAPKSNASIPSVPVGGHNFAILKERKKQRARFAEMAGETAAECAAICCCCPFGLVNLLVVVAVKLPAGLVRRALRRNSQKKTAIVRPRVGVFDDDDLIVHRGSVMALAGNEVTSPVRSPSEEMPELEKVMLAYFYGAGFWRSPSQRE